MKKLKKDDLVVFRCTNPAIGWVDRVAKDGSWADVEWFGSRKHPHVSRQLTRNIIKLNPIFNKLATEGGFFKAFLPEAYE